MSDREEEFRTLKNFKFLGYGISFHGLFMHADTQKRLIRKLSRLINLYLIHYIERHKPNPKRVGVGFDWDLMGLISEIRNVLYGGLSEDDLSRFVKDGRKLPHMRGLMGFYALLDDKVALVALDGWLVSTIKQALIKRYGIFSSHGISMQAPDAKSLIFGGWYLSNIYSHGSFVPDARMPSFVRAWSAARKYYFAFGLEHVEAPRYLAYY